MRHNPAHASDDPALVRELLRRPGHYSDPELAADVVGPRKRGGSER